MIKIVFCLPGSNFSTRFLRAWTKLLHACFRNYGVETHVRGAASSNIYIVRNNCLGGILGGPENQKPFQGEINYDYIMWIDSDIIFEPEQFKLLLDQMESDKKIHILSGLYFHESERRFVAVKQWNSTYYKKHQSHLFLLEKDVKGKNQPIKVDYAGMGFMLIRKGVFERLDYPWFNPLDLNTGPDQKSFSREDAAFCLKAKKAGINTYVDPETIVGHEKLTVII